MAGPRLPVLLLVLLAVLCAALAERGNHLVGGFTEATLSEEGVQRALDFAVMEYNRASNDGFHSRMFRFLRGRKQVVAGMKYILEVELRRTTCLKTVTDISNCPFNEDSQFKKAVICTFEVYSIPWLGKTSLLKSNCKNA